MMRRFLFCAFALLIAMPSLHSQVTVHVYGAQWEEYPLVKKIGLYQTPLVSKAWLDRDFPKLAELEARSMRYEMACGKDDLYGQPCVVGSAERPAYSLANVDYLLTLAQKYCPVLVISHGYTPTILQSRPTEWSGFMDPPINLSSWSAINERFAQEWKNKGFTNSYVEVWNEPDLKDGFFTGGVDEYLDIYEAAAPAVNRGYPDVKVGGPAGAFNWWHQSLVDRVKANDIPLDFLSGHAYGPDYSWQINGMRSALNSLGRNEAEMLLTEYSPYTAAEYQKDGPVEKAEAAMTFFNALPGFLECTDLSFVNWAQYIDPGFFVGDKLGLIDRDSGARKALFNAFKLYGMMPSDRRRMSVSGSNVKGLASASPDCMTTVLWNTSTNEQPLSIKLDSIPFGSGTLEVYHIDEEHNSWYETKNGQLTKSRSEHIEISDGSLRLEDTVRSKGVCFIRVVADNAPVLYPKVALGTIVRTHQWFPKRTNTASYALFDPKTWTVRLSSNKDATGLALIGIEATRVPNVLKVEGLRKGIVQRRSSNSTLNIRVDYQDRNGEYVHSVLYHEGVYTTGRTFQLPWGTKRTPDEIVEVESLNDCSIDVAAHKPDSFNGRVTISFELQNVGMGVKQNFQLSRGSSSGVEGFLEDSDGMGRGNDGRPQEVYNPCGQRQPQLVKGINIVHSPDGSTQKIFVK
ncbi:MAG: hypothetical protein II061_05710 [Bacteroidaceae bacterium]|nr:hypothetical protein [Bacteroidaceae bacterium]